MVNMALKIHHPPLKLPLPSKKKLKNICLLNGEFINQNLIYHADTKNYANMMMRNFIRVCQKPHLRRIAHLTVNNRQMSSITTVLNSQNTSVVNSKTNTY